MGPGRVQQQQPSQQQQQQRQPTAVQHNATLAPAAVGLDMLDPQMAVLKPYLDTFAGTLADSLAADAWQPWAPMAIVALQRDSDVQLLLQRLAQSVSYSGISGSGLLIGTELMPWLTAPPSHAARHGMASDEQLRNWIRWFAPELWASNVVRYRSAGRRTLEDAITGYLASAAHVQQWQRQLGLKVQTVLQRAKAEYGQQPSCAAASGLGGPPATASAAGGTAGAMLPLAAAAASGLGCPAMFQSGAGQGNVAGGVLGGEAGLMSQPLLALSDSVECTSLSLIPELASGSWMNEMMEILASKK